MYASHKLNLIYSHRHTKYRVPCDKVSWANQWNNEWLLMNEIRSKKWINYSSISPLFIEVPQLKTHIFSSSFVFDLFQSRVFIWKHLIILLFLNVRDNRREEIKCVLRQNVRKPIAIDNQIRIVCRKRETFCQWIMAGAIEKINIFV